jgi:hypothetical protein
MGRKKDRVIACQCDAVMLLPWTGCLQWAERVNACLNLPLTGGEII